MSEFGKEILRLRTEKEIHLSIASQAVGIPQSRLSELERGVRIPTEGQVDRLEDFYSLTKGALAKLMK